MDWEIFFSIIKIFVCSVVGFFLTLAILYFAIFYLNPNWGVPILITTMIIGMAFIWARLSYLDNPGK